jgi:hypothetical protein
VKRKEFLSSVLPAVGCITMLPNLLLAQDQEKPPALDANLVKDFVIAGHGNLDKVKQMLEATPNLLYATWDWGGGDFETALEGAGHVGNKAIANFLIEKGARTNFFVLTMLGKTQLVKPFIESFPSCLTARGPHGLSFLHHAQRGGDDAKDLLAYFQSKGLLETKFNLY